MSRFNYFLLIFFPLLSFFRGYAFYTNRFEKFILGGFYDTERPNVVVDKEGYRKQVGKSYIIIGVMFLLLLPIAYLVDKSYLQQKYLFYVLSIWLIVDIVIGVMNHLKLRKYIKKV